MRGEGIDIGQGDTIRCTVDGEEREVTGIEEDRVYVEPPVSYDESFIPLSGFDVGLWEVL